MRSRQSGLRRVRRLALGALALASLLAAASGSAQQAPSDALGLRGDVGASAAPAEAPAAASLVPSAPDPAIPTPEKKKPRPKSAAKIAPLGVYPGAQRLGQRGGPANFSPPARRPRRRSPRFRRRRSSIARRSTTSHSLPGR